MNRRQRTLDARAHQAGRFRAETVPRAPSRPRTLATIGEILVAKQMARAERSRRNEE
jgi:hypothetical protein